MAKAESSAIDRRFLESDIERGLGRFGQVRIVEVVAHQRSTGVRQDRKERVQKSRQPGRTENVRVPETGLPGRHWPVEQPAVAGDAGDRSERLVDRKSAVGRHEPEAQVVDHTWTADHVHIVGRAGRPQVPAGAHPHPEHIADQPAAIAADRVAPVVGHPTGRVRQPTGHAHVSVPIRPGRPAELAQAERSARQSHLLRLQRQSAEAVTTGVGPGVLGPGVCGWQLAD